jgi:hypothetical protein
LPEHVQEAMGQDSHEQPGLVHGEAPPTGLVPAKLILPLFDSVLNIAASVVRLDHFPGKEPGIGHDEPDSWEEFRENLS